MIKGENMPSKVYWVVLFFLFVTFDIARQSHADGGFFADLNTHLYEPDQWRSYFGTAIPNP